PSFTCESFYLGSNDQAITNHRGEVVQQVRQVASGFLLNEKGENQNLDFQKSAALGQAAQSGLRRQAQILLFITTKEFTGDGIVKFICDRLEGLGHGLSGSDHASHQIEGVRELPQKLFRAGFAFEVRSEERRVGKECIYRW